MKWFFIFILSIFILLKAENANAMEEIIRDGEAEYIIKKLTKPIFLAAGFNPDNIQIFIINSKSLNAFVIDDKHVFVNWGLLKFSDDPNVILGVIAHEVGHISAGHIAQRSNYIQNSILKVNFGYLLGIITALTINPDIGQAIALGSNHINNQAFLSYNRHQEEMADQYALKYLDQAGYSKDGIMKFLRYLSQIERVSTIDPYVSTHPLSAQRLLYFQNYKMKFAHYTRIHNDDLVKFKRAIVKLDAFIETLEVLNQKYIDNSIDSQYAQAIIAYRQANFISAIDYINNLINADSQNPYFYELKAQIFYKTGNIKESIINYKKALSLLKDEDSLLIKLELVQPLLINNHNEAIAYLEQILVKEEENTYVWQQLSIAYAKNNNLGASYFALTRKSFIERDWVNFNKYAELAKKHLSKNSSYLLKIQDMQEAKGKL